MVLHLAKPTHSTAKDLPVPESAKDLRREERGRRTEMYNPRLRSIIRSLQLRNIHNMPTHTRGGHEAALPKRWLQLHPINRLLLLLLPTPMYPRYSRTVERPIEICCHDFSVMVKLASYGCALRPGDTGVGDEDVEAAVKFADYRFHGCGHGFEGSDVDLVCFACPRKSLSANHNLVYASGGWRGEYT